MKKRSLAAVLSLSLVAGTLAGFGLTAQASSDTTVIKAVTGGSPIPYIYVNEDGEVDGCDAAVLRAVFERLPQYDLQFEVASFESMFGGLNTGNYQIAFNMLSYNEERGASYLFSYPYVKVQYVFVTRPDDDPITSFSEIGGKKFEDGAGVSVTNAVEAWNEEHPDEAVEITYTEADMAAQLQRLVDGVTDFKIFDLAMFNAYVEEFNLDLVATPVPDEEAEAIASSTYAYYLLPLDQPELREEIDEVLKELQADGTLSELTEQYLGSDLAPDADQYEETIN